MDLITFKLFLKELSESKLVRVTGSYADGTQNYDSDIDFYVKPDNPEYKCLGLKRNIDKIINILKKYNIKAESDMMGYLHTHKSNNELPIQVEFSDLFSTRKNRLKEVEIMSVKFKTY